MGVPFIASESAKSTAVLSLALLNFGGNGINVALLLIALRPQMQGKVDNL